MIKEEDYLKAKQIVQEYEKQLNISGVMYRLKQLLHKEIDIKYVIFGWMLTMLVAGICSN